MRTARWLLVAVLWMAGLYVWLFGTILLESVVLGFCPHDLLVSGTCAAGWYPAAQTAARCLGAALSASAAVGLPSLVAPTAHRWVAWCAFGLGAGVAAWFAYLLGSSASWPLLAALGAGVLAAARCSRRRLAV